MFSIFSHPDYTVGSGFSPDLLCEESLGSRAHPVVPGIPPVRNCRLRTALRRFAGLTMPRRLWSNLCDSVDSQPCFGL